jgi:2-polyprenyl-3-methyl-5-hydroxy-6-metoxy-1,4-benzoquinol methylase
MLNYVDPEDKSAFKTTDQNFISESGKRYEVINKIPRFVTNEKYANSFGFQWNKYVKTQLDSRNENLISENRLKNFLNEHLTEIKGKNVLEVGCGAGRFTEILLKYGANAHATDLSNAVEANYKNLHHYNNYQIAQADINQLPYPENSFDLVLCIGVVQHTQNPHLSITNLYKYVKPGGVLAYDQYLLTPFYYTKPVLIFRYFLRKMQPEKAYQFINKLAEKLFPIQWRFRNSIIMTFLLNRISPLYTYFTKFKDLNYDQHLELTKLDTFDGLTDFYKHLTTVSKTKSFLQKFKFSKLTIKEGGNGVEVIGIK